MDLELVPQDTAGSGRLEAHGGAGQGRQQRCKHPGVGKAGNGHPGRGASPGEEAW